MVISIDRRAPLVFSGSLTTWTTTSWPGLSRSEIFLPPSLPRPAAGRLDAGQHDLVDVQEAVLVEADVDEGGLEAGQDIVDLALVDVADDRAVAAPLEVQLGDAVAGGGVLPAPAPGLGAPGVPVDSSSATRVSPRIHADEYLLLHESCLLESQDAALGGRRCAPCA